MIVHFRKKKIVYETYTGYTGSDRLMPKRKPMQRPPALYVVYAKSNWKAFCGFEFARLYNDRFAGFEFKNYKKAIQYTKRFRSEQAALNQVERLDKYYNGKHKKPEIVFKAFKIEAEEKWEEAYKRWLEEYDELELPKDDE